MNMKLPNHIEKIAWLLGVLALIRVILDFIQKSMYECQSIWWWRDFVLIIVLSVLLLKGLLLIRNKNKLKHSEDLIKDFQYPEVSFNSYLKDGLKLEVEPSLSKEINRHLDAHWIKSSTDDKLSVYGLIEKRDFYIHELHNKMLKTFCDDLKDDLLRCVMQVNYFDKQNIEPIEISILGVIRNYYEDRRQPLSFKIYSNHTHHNLVCEYNYTIWIEGHSEQELKEIEELKKELIKKFDDAFKSKKFELLIGYYKKINNNQIRINQELKQIIDKVRTGTPFEGHCSECLKADFFWGINYGT